MKRFLCSFVATMYICSSVAFPVTTLDKTEEYNFAKALQYSLYFYDQEMCGNQLELLFIYRIMQL